MAFLERHRRNDALTKQTDFLASNRATLDRKPETALFYEFEVAIVVDAIYDENHPEVRDKTIIENQYPKNLNGNDPTTMDVDYGWIGRIKFRFINTDKGVSVQQLQWASPLEITGVTEIPLINELVSVVNYMGKFYYTRRINSNGFINSSADFGMEPYYSGTGEPIRKKNEESIINVSPDGKGSLGDVFKYNERIRSLRRYEGDTIIESRFGSSIRFGGYGKDDGTNKNSPGGDYPSGTGNPWILIRNRQAKADTENKVPNHPKTYVTESINNDGSSIQLTSGATVSDFKTTCKKVIFQSGVGEEQKRFSPIGPTKTNFKYPKLDGDQIVINSDRLVFQARGQEFLQYSKKRFAITTDNEFTVDAKDQAVITTNKHLLLNSPTIYLGNAETAEPALLGRSTVMWLHTMCDWMLNNTNSQIATITAVMTHFHIGKGSPTTPPMPPAMVLLGLQLVSLQAQQISLLALQMQLNTLMSSRVFVTGGGGAP